MRLLLIAATVALQSATVNFAGTWTLDTYVSDNPEQVAAAIHADLRLQPDTTFVMSGSRNGGFGRRREPDKSSSKAKAPSADEQKQIDDLTMTLRYPPPTLRLDQRGDTVTFADDQGQTHTLNHWEGPQLVATTDLGNGRRMRSTYSLVPTTNQLMIRTAIERAPNEPGPFEIKQLYDRAGATR